MVSNQGEAEMSGGGGGVIIIGNALRSLGQTEAVKSGLSPASCAKLAAICAKLAGDWTTADVREACRLIAKAHAELKGCE
jgi:hypothetical protein